MLGLDFDFDRTVQTKGSFLFVRRDLIFILEVFYNSALNVYLP